MDCVIYKIHNTVNDHIYIGSSINFLKRKKEHLSALKNSKHRNRYLQRAFSKYGENCFRFSVIEKCNKQELIKLEQHWIDLAQHEETKLYNLEKVALRTNFIKPRRYWLGKKRSKEDVEKFIKSHIGIVGKKPNPLYPGVTQNK